MSGPLETGERSLTADERRILEEKIAWTQARLASAPWRTALAGGCVIGPLVAVTCLASDDPWPWILGFWALVGGGIMLSVHLPEVRSLARSLAAQRDALARNLARTTRLRPEAVVVIEDDDDEGPCYVFGLAGGRLLFLHGYVLDLELPEGAAFPSTDFEIAELGGAPGRPVCGRVVPLGQPLAPVRHLPVAFRREYQLPDHEAVLDGRLDRLEQALPRWPRK